MSWPAIAAELEAELGESITIDSLTARWRIAQRAAGHRHSVDDVLTAHYALCAVAGRRIVRMLDLGSGIGGVGLLALWGLGSDAQLVCIEAQEISYRLLVANLAGNQLAERVDARHGDLRELAMGERFALITASPPYFPPGSGVMPADSQKAHARFELRGDVADYARAAARHLAGDGVFVFCFPTPQRARAVAGVRAAGLHVVAMRDVVPRAGLAPLFTLFACARAQPEQTEPAAEPAAEPAVEPAVEPACRIDPPLVVRTREGEVTDEMNAVRRGFGFGTPR